MIVFIGLIMNILDNLEIFRFALQECILSKYAIIDMISVSKERSNILCIYRVEVFFVSNHRYYRPQISEDIHMVMKMVNLNSLIKICYNYGHVRDI